jgi:hypothetical protein
LSIECHGDHEVRRGGRLASVGVRDKQQQREPGLLTREPCQTTGPIWSVEWLGNMSGVEMREAGILLIERNGSRGFLGGESLAGPALPQTGTNATLKPLQPL